MKIKNTEINQLRKPYQSTLDFEKFLNVNLYENPDQLILDNNKNLIQNRV